MAQGRRKGSQLLWGIVTTFGWAMASSTLVILNAHLYRRGFPYPFFVTAGGQLFSALGGVTLGLFGFLPVRPPSALSSKGGHELAAKTGS